MREIVIATRASPLARAQALSVGEALARAEPRISYRLLPLTTRGDRIKGELPRFGGKGLFVREVQEAVLQGKADLAVHSAKDLPSEPIPGLVLAAVPPREDPRDALLGTPLAELPRGARVGTSSLRRASQLKAFRSDLTVIPFRGNVDTRLAKLARGEVDAAIMSLAGLRRLGLEAEVVEVLDPHLMTPAPGQGCLAVEAREADQELIALLEAVSDQAARTELEAERAFLQALGGGCFLPAGCLARLEGQILQVQAVLAAVDGSEVHRVFLQGDPSEASTLGRRAAAALRAAGASLLEGARAREAGPAAGAGPGREEH